MAKKNQFQEDLERQLKDPEFAEAFAEELAELRLGSKIKKLRLKQGLSQRDLAQKVGTSQSVIARMESAGYRGYSTTMLTRLARSLGARLVIDFKPSPESR